MPWGGVEAGAKAGGIIIYRGVRVVDTGATPAQGGASVFGGSAGWPAGEYVILPRPEVVTVIERLLKSPTISDVGVEWCRKRLSP